MTTMVTNETFQFLSFSVSDDDDDDEDEKRCVQRKRWNSLKVEGSLRIINDDD